MRDAEVAVVWDAHLGGWPVSLIGIESRPLPRRGTIPADGPEQWTAGTLFPRVAKKIARALNAAAGRRPVVVLANLAGFDGSPESLREWQLEFGAEIAPGGRQLRRSDRVLRPVALPRRRVRGLLAEAESEPRDGRARGRPRLGDRRRPGGRGRVRPRGRAGRRRRRANPGARERVAQAEGAERQRLRAEQGRAVGRGAGREAASVCGAVRPGSQHRASRSDGLGEERHRTWRRCGGS